MALIGGVREARFVAPGHEPEGAVEETDPGVILRMRYVYANCVQFFRDEQVELRSIIDRCAPTDEKTKLMWVPL